MFGLKAKLINGTSYIVLLKSGFTRRLFFTCNFVVSRSMSICKMEYLFSNLPTRKEIDFIHVGIGGDKLNPFLVR